MPSSPPSSPPLRPSSTPTAVEIPEPLVIETLPSSSSEPEHSVAARTELANRRNSTTPPVPLPLLIVPSAEMNQPRSDEEDPYCTALVTPSTLAPESDMDTYSGASASGETEGRQVLSTLFLRPARSVC